jgi:hypothetical protein
VSVCIFVGPTLRRAEVAAVLDATCLPPAAQGDIYRAAQGRPRAIGLIDGYFSGAPAVWHKEILWALSQGIAVFGSASMGALRAAELHGFGMQGVGQIFAAFRDGTLEDDDEVAVVHAPEALGYGAMSEAMVNVRATLAQAEAARIVGRESRQALERFAKTLFYPQRTWPAVLDGAHGVAAGEIGALRSWLPGGRVDQKHDDALAMLQAMRAAPDAAAPSFAFAWTQLWDELTLRLDAEPIAATSAGAPPAARVLDELRLADPEGYGRARATALVRLLAELEARRRGLDPAAEARRAALAALRSEHGLFTRASLVEWLARNHLDEAGLGRLLADEARARAVAALAGAALDRYLLDVLKREGAYEQLCARATAKQAALAARGLDDAGDAAATNAMAARLWFFEQRLKRPLPDDVAAFAQELGFADLREFDSALLREQVYVHEQATTRDR